MIGVIGFGSIFTIILFNQKIKLASAFGESNFDKKFV
jgi:hypothetical protein